MFGAIAQGANTFLDDDNVRPVSLDFRILFVTTLQNCFNAANSL